MGCNKIKKTLMLDIKEIEILDQLDYIFARYPNRKNDTVQAEKIIRELFLSVLRRYNRDDIIDVVVYVSNHEKELYADFLECDYFVRKIISKINITLLEGGYFKRSI